MISIIVPVYNEEESLDSFYKVLSKNIPSDSEIIFVDDGSRDKSLKILKEFASKDKKVRIFSFRKNHGKAEALTLGFQKAKGEKIVTLDADLQDRPEEIDKLLKKLDEGFDLVSGWRKDRKDSKIFINFPSKFFNFLSSFFWGLKLNDYNCGLKAYTIEAAKSLNLYGGMQRFIPLLLYQNGFKVTEISVVHEARRYGKSKYGFSKSFKEFPDMFTMLFLSKYKSKPMHFFGIIGISLILFAVLILLYLTGLWFMGERIGNRPLLFLGILLAISGLQIFFTGFLADLILHFSKQDSNETPLLRYQSEE
jgi:glycosyltransferase involved in cell wall biosynthesis